MERLLLTGRACTDRHGAGACTVTCQVVIFVCRGELDGNWSRLELTAQQREPTRRKEVGIGDRWHHRYGLESTACVRACLCTVGVCRERKRSGSKRGESERGTAGIRAVAWLGSDWAESQAKDSDVPLPCAPSFPFLSFTFPSPRVSSRSRARTSRAVHSVNRDSVDSDVGSATRDSSLDRFFPPRPALLRNPNCGSSRDHRNLFNADCCSVKLSSDYTGRSRWRPRIDGTNFRGDLLPESNDNWPDRRANNAIFIIGKRYFDINRVIFKFSSLVDDQFHSHSSSRILFTIIASISIKF